MDEINYPVEEHRKFTSETKPPKGTILGPSVSMGNWYRPDDAGITIDEERREFLKDLKAGTARAQAYLAEIIAWRMNRGDT